MQSKLKKMESLKKNLNVINKASEAKRKETIEKKQIKKNRPKGMRAKKTGMVIFWFLFSFMFLVVLVNVFGTSDSLDDDQEMQNKLHSHEAYEFSKDFVYHYFTWSTDKHAQDERKANLEHFLADGIDHLGGIVFDRQWASIVEKDNIILKEIIDLDKDSARHIYKVTYTQISETDEENTDVNVDRLNFEEYNAYKNGLIVKNGKKTKVNEHFISVPIHYDKTTNRFKVFKLPSFTYVDEGVESNPINDPLYYLKRVTDNYVKNNVVAFTETFFSSYAQDNRDKLSYILEDEQHQNGLNGSMLFSKIESIEIYQVDDNHNRFVAEAYVILKDPNTEFEFTNQYLMVIKRVDQRYVVESLNNEKYVSDLAEEYITRLNEESEEEVNDTNSESEIDNQL